jgi:hypothetical protein
VRLRYVHSGMLTVDDWETQYDGADRHTDFYLHSLAEFLAHFAGQPVTYVSANAPEHSLFDGAYDALIRGLGLDAAPSVGDSVQLSIDGLPAVDAVVDYVHDGWFLGLRSSDTLYRFYVRTSQGAPVQAAHHMFGDGVDADTSVAAWTSWLNGVYVPAPANA